jgi:hypothetical protein
VGKPVACGSERISGTARRKYMQMKLRSGVALLMPLPGAADDFIELRIRRFPAELRFDFFRAGDQNGGISGTAGQFFDRNGAAGYPASGVNDLADAEAGSISDVVNKFPFGAQCIQCKQVRTGEVVNVNIVAVG